MTIYVEWGCKKCGSLIKHVQPSVILTLGGIPHTNHLFCRDCVVGFCMDYIMQPSLSKAFEYDKDKKA